MDNFFNKTILPVTLGALPLVIVTTGIAGFLAYRYSVVQEKRYDDLKAELHSEVVVLGDKLAALDQYTRTVGHDVAITKNESTQLTEKLRQEQENVSKISGTIGTLEKLAKTDPELLAKYSKVFFLSENYIPERLVDIPTNYLYSDNRPERFEQRVLPYLQKMIDEAKLAGVTIYIKSGYRSFAEQKELKNAYSVTYGAGTANQFSAEQGYSEHQLGTTVDFITTGLGGQLSGFEKTTAYTWLLGNAHRYGFTLSYPPGNSFYIYEPWHWRFVGIALATRLKNENIHFYDLDQREIDKYLVNILD
ncbi:M15 family metallopeptidase [bacterium]|nr:M15 family metallopeptidase [bacterium]